jgi:hypothetical protein
VGTRRTLALVTALLAVSVSSAHAALGARKPTAAKPRLPLGRALAGDWRTWWGSATLDAAGGATLASAVPTAPAETHSALITSRRTWSNPTISFSTTTLAQLRAGSAPNPWEVAWVMFRFRDLANYYYFILKTNGFELGKKQGSDEQIFLDTGTLPSLSVGAPRQIQVQAKGPRIRVWVDGAHIVDFTDPHPLAGPGSVGLYEEDSRVRFDSVSIN